MKKFARILVLVLVVVMLTACGESTKTFTCNDLTITVPSKMLDVSSNSDFAGYTFTLDSSKIAIFGIQETYADYDVLKDYDLKSYTDLCIQANGLDCLAVQRATADYYYFEYTANNPDGTYRYMTGCFQSDAGFWIVQVCALATEYDQEAFLSYLDSVSFS